MIQAQRIVFAGSPEFAVTQLDAMLAARLPVCGVLSQPDRPAGRKRKLQPTPVKTRALDLGIPVATPATLRSGDGPAQLSSMEPDLLVVAAYGLILPQAVLDLPHWGCINVHASLLPRWRGAAPVERAMMAGDTHVGVGIMEMAAGLDTGPVRLERTLEIGAAETGGELEGRLALLGAECLVEVLRDLEAHPPQPQADTGVTYADKLSKNDAVFDPSLSAEVLARRIRALNPRMPVQARTSDDFRLRLLRAHARPEVAGEAVGTLLGVDREGLRIATGEGTLLVTEAQLVGGKGTRLTGANLHNALGDRLPAGALLTSG